MRPWCTPGLRLYQTMIERIGARLHNQRRLRSLAQVPDVTIFCAHDPADFERLTGSTVPPLRTGRHGTTYRSRPCGCVLQVAVAVLPALGARRTRSTEAPNLPRQPPTPARRPRSSAATSAHAPSADARCAPAAANRRPGRPRLPRRRVPGCGPTSGARSRVRAASAPRRSRYSANTSTTTSRKRKARYFQSCARPTLISPRWGNRSARARTS